MLLTDWPRDPSQVVKTQTRRVDRIENNINVAFYFVPFVPI